jgi:Uma2 family endonuclease
MTSVETLLTAEEFAGLPEPRDGGKMELVDGKVVCMTPVGEQHGDGALAIGGPLRAFARRHALGVVGAEVGFRVSQDPDTVLAPDVAFTSIESLDPDRDVSRLIVGAPTLAVEIMSPNDLEQDVSQKVDRYLSAGTARVWVVRPAAQSITVHRPGGDAHTYRLEDTLNSDDAGFTVDGFELALGDIFA